MLEEKDSAKNKISHWMTMLYY